MLERLRGLARSLARGRPGASADLEAGRTARRLAGWTPSRAHVNTLISASGNTTTARARFLYRNNGYAAGAVECFAANVIGAGIVPSWRPPGGHEGLKPAVTGLWRAWTDEADAEGLTDFYGLQRRIARELFVAGEVFVRLRPRYARDGLAVPLQLQVLPSEMLPLERTEDLANGNRIRQGVEFDRIGRRLAYHFWRTHPGDSTDIGRWGETVRVPAAEVLHVLDPLEGGQVRGLSRLTPAIVPLWSLDGYDDAELERKKTAALFSLFVIRPDPNGEMFDKELEKQATAAGGTATVKLEPGSAQVLLPGEDIKIAEPADSGPSFEAFQYRALTRICAGLGLPYMGVTGDVMRANYSNVRGALVESRRRLDAVQHGVFVFQLCRPVFNAFLDAAVLAGALRLPGYAAAPRPWRRITWIPPRWEWVDPKKDREAEAVAVDNGFKSRSQVIEAEGFDPGEVDALIAEDLRREKTLGLQFPRSAKPAADPAGDDEDDDENTPDDENKRAVAADEDEA